MSVPPRGRKFDELQDFTLVCLLARNTRYRPLLYRSLAICALVFACTLTYPFNNDNALYAYMSALLLEGKLPYLGSWDQNAPGILLVHMPQIVLMGRSQFAFHLWDIALQLIGCYYLFRLGLQLSGRASAVIAPLLAAFYYVHQGFWMAGERDTYVTILLLAATFEMIRDDRTHMRIGLSGSLFGFAVLFRPTYGLALSLALVWVLIHFRSLPKSARFALGGAAPVVALLLIYLLSAGLSELYLAVIGFNTSIYIGQGSVFSFWQPIKAYWWLVPFALLGAYSLLRERRSTLILLLGMMAAGVASLLLLYRFSVYHYHPAMVIFLLIAAVGVGRASDMIAAKSRSLRGQAAIRLACYSLLFVVVGIQSFRGNTIKHVLSNIATGKISTIWEAYSYYEPDTTFGVLKQREVGEYLRSRTRAGEAVQMFGPYSFPQYFSHTSTASRFQTLHALTMRQSERPLQDFQLRWREEYLRDLESVKPKYFVVCDAPEAFRQYYGGRLGHEILREDMTEVGASLQRDYLADTTIGAFTIYKRRGS
jgi:hypothetical protein